MADRKISELPDNTTPTNEDYFPIDNLGVTKKMTLSGLTSFIEDNMGKDLVYEALLDQYEPTPIIVGEPLRIGEVYEILYFESGDDFSNMEVIPSSIAGNGIMNTVGCYFRATSTTPINWVRTELISKGWPIARVIDNTIDPDLYWYRNENMPFGVTYKGWYDLLSPNGAVFPKDRLVVHQPTNRQMILNNPSFFADLGAIIMSFSPPFTADNQINPGWQEDSLTLQTGVAGDGYVTLQDDKLRSTYVKVVVKQNPF